MHTWSMKEAIITLNTTVLCVATSIYDTQHTRHAYLVNPSAVAALLVLLDQLQEKLLQVYIATIINCTVTTYTPL